MEAMDGFTDALVAAMELGADLLGSVPLVARQQNLAAAQGEGVGRSQALFQGHQFLWIKLAHHYCSHASRMSGFLVLSTIHSWICTRIVQRLRPWDVVPVKTWGHPKWRVWI